jgi:hypothetical protein
MATLIDISERYAARHLSPVERFEFFSMPEPNSGCQLWLGSLSESGYGETSLNGKSIRAHRAVWIVANGPIPAGLCVCHKCDVRACIALPHLKLGTHQDNTDDRVLKGRRIHVSMPGELNPAAKLTPAQVVQIFCSPKSESQLAEEYAVHESTVGGIRRGQKWAALTLQLTGSYEEPWS